MSLPWHYLSSTKNASTNLCATIKRDSLIGPRFLALPGRFNMSANTAWILPAELAAGGCGGAPPNPGVPGLFISV